MLKRLTARQIDKLSQPKYGDPIRHHFVPVLLLKGFVRDGTDEISIHFKNGNTIASSPEGIGYQKHLYTIKHGKSGKQSLLVEKLNSLLFEGPAGEVLKRIRKKKRVRFKDRPALAQLVAFQLVRTPFYRKCMLEAYKGMTERDVVKYISKYYLGKPTTFKGKRFKANPLDEHAKQFLFTTKMFDEVAKKWKALALRKWRVLVAPPQAYFITSSMGFGLDSADRSSDTVSFDDDNCIIYFPIGSHVCLEISHGLRRKRELKVEYVELLPTQTVFVNRQVSFLADLFLVSRNPKHQPPTDAFSANMVITREDQKKTNRKRHGV